MKIFKSKTKEMILKKKNIGTYALNDKYLIIKVITIIYAKMKSR
jgi:hypothetical protein